MVDPVTSELVNKGFNLLDSIVLPDFYGPPSMLDDATAELLVALAEGPSDDWDAVSRALTEQRRRALGRYALRAPMVALNTEIPRHLHAGLLAYCLIRQHVGDWRDDMVHFAPVVHVGNVLGVNVTALFDEAAAYAVPDLASVMRTFGRRTDITLEAFGYRKVETPDSTTFETVNWGGTPSGAVIGQRSWDTVNQAMAQDLLEWIRKQKEGTQEDRQT